MAGTGLVSIAVLALWLCFSNASGFETYNYTISSRDDNGMELIEVFRNGRKVFIPEYLLKKLEHELETWHWYPYLRTRTKTDEDKVQEVMPCVMSENSLESFPDSIFTEEQLRQGAFLLYALFGIYAFTLLTIVCNDYFIPCVELICEDLKIPQNVAAATFMAVATSTPEFFVNTISTFMTESDMGIGTIIGSAIFNALGVSAIGGLAAIKPIPIDKRPVTRDVIIYMVNVGVLVAIVWDGQVDWYEAVALGVMYVMYFIIMFNSVRMFNLYDKLVGNCCTKKDVPLTEMQANGNAKSVDEGLDNAAFEDPENLKANNYTDGKEDRVSVKGENIAESSSAPSIFSIPRGDSTIHTIWMWYTWPLRIILGLTIPSTVTYRRFYPLAFILCIIWIGINSYFVSWSMSVLGHTFLIPDSVMGMTFLAFGGCLPEACSIYIMSRRGEGGIGVSNALGANSLAILFALGMPWLIRTLSLVAQGADQTAVLINSAGIDFIVGSILLVVVSLWIVLFLGKFTLRPAVGGVLLALYVAFITFAILVETGVILQRTFGFC